VDRENILGKKENDNIKERKERRAKERGLGDPREDANATVDGIVRFPKLRTKS